MDPEPAQPLGGGKKDFGSMQGMGPMPDDLSVSGFSPWHRDSSSDALVQALLWAGFYLGLLNFWQADAQKTEARTFRSLGQPRTRHLLLSTLVVCTLLVLLVGVPYAANEVLLRFTCNFSDSRAQALAVCPELARLLFFPRFPISMGRA